MPTNQSTTPLRQDVWTGCYGSSWSDLIVPEAYSHPAKFSRSLIQTIYKHCAEEGWLKPGDTVLDCFAGTGLGGLDAALAGYRFIGVELEGRFHALAHGFDCGGSDAKHDTCSQQGDHAAHHVTGNLELWARRYGHLSQYVAPTLLQGDSRELDKILREQVSACVASPPYAGSQIADVRHLHFDEQRRDRCWGQIQQIHKEGLVGYGEETPGNLGALPPGTLDACLSSPPFQGSLCNGQLSPAQLAEMASRGHKPSASGNSAAYGTHPAQLGNLPAGQVEAVIDSVVASPPFERCIGDAANRPEYKTIRPHLPDAAEVAAYLKHYRKLAGLSAKDIDKALGTNTLYSWYEGRPAGTEIPTPEHWLQLKALLGFDDRFDHGILTTVTVDATGKYTTDHTGHAKITTYGTSPGQLGTEHGTTFWEASKLILQQVFDLLRPNGVAIFVVKDYVRGGAIVPFSQQWRALCEHIGFVTLHIHHALLVEEHGTQGGLFGADTTHRTSKKSFFRRLHERKRPDLAIDSEVVYCMQKPLHTAAGTLELCCASPPYAGAGEVLNPHNGIDWSKAASQTGAALTPGRAMQPYGQTEGQLGGMTPGSLDLCLSSPPYAESLNDATNRIDWRKAEGGRRDRTREANYATHQGSGITAQAYGTTEGQLGAMREGPRPHPEEDTP